MQQTLFTLLILFSLLSCSGGQDDESKKKDTPSSTTISEHRKPGCRGCHAMVLDAAHDFECTLCHQGDPDSSQKEPAHANLIKRPAHPDNMAETCGKCHPEQVQETGQSLHFTLHNEVNSVRIAFGAEQSLPSLTDIPVAEYPESPLELVDDLLRRRCLRCHPYYSGDRYPAVVRGTGCASCHLHFYEGKLVSHSFLKTPGDNQCLQCHYGNRVGFDYYGRYEHDMNDEYRTPYTTRNDYFRPYGMEYHQLSGDIHQQAGLICVDCHSGKELMGDDHEKIGCADCHDRNEITENNGLISLDRLDSSFHLPSKGSGKKHLIPLMQHPAHREYENVACQVCHAQWSFNDDQTNLLRSDLEEYDDFSRLTVQGSYEIEKIVKNNLEFSAEELPHAMTDKISGQSRPGLWYKGFLTRRWENVIIGRDDAGVLQVMRPVLDIRLSWINEDEEVPFDSIEPMTAGNDGLLPYTPHTTGKAGLFYKERIGHFLRSENSVKE